MRKRKATQAPAQAGSGAHAGGCGPSKPKTPRSLCSVTRSCGAIPGHASHLPRCSFPLKGTIRGTGLKEPNHITQLGRKTPQERSGGRACNRHTRSHEKRSGAPALAGSKTRLSGAAWLETNCKLINVQLLMPCLLFFTRIKINCAAWARKQPELSHLGGGTVVPPAPGAHRFPPIPSAHRPRSGPHSRGGASGQHNRTGHRAERGTVLRALRQQGRPYHARGPAPPREELPHLGQKVD